MSYEAQNFRNFVVSSFSFSSSSNMDHIKVTKSSSPETDQ